MTKSTIEELSKASTYVARHPDGTIDIYSKDGKHWICSLNLVFDRDEEKQMWTADRICACWNACSGLTDDELKVIAAQKHSEKGPSSFELTHISSGE